MATEINNIEEDYFEELYELLKRFAQSKQRSVTPLSSDGLEIINVHADELNQEVEDVLTYQVAL